MKNILYPSTILCLLIALLLSADRCTYNRKIANSAFASIADTVTYFKNNINTQSASVKTITMQKDQLEKLILNKDAELAKLTQHFSKVQTINTYTNFVRHDTIAVTYKDTIPYNFNRTGKTRTRWYSFSYRSDNNGFALDSLTIPNRTIVITGFKRKWFLGKETAITDITNSNPHIHTETMQSLLVTVPVPWYKKWYVWLGAGLAGGFLISK